MQEDYNIGDVITIVNVDYCIVKKYNKHYVIVTIGEPLDIKVGKFEDDKFVIENDKEIIKEVLQSK